MPSAEADTLVTLDDIRQAAYRLRGVSLRTPLLPLAGGGYAKAESLQPIGAFKLRGAYNAIIQLTDNQRQAGVVTHSSGNHGQAVAYVARLLGIRAVVVMPDNAPAIKVDRVRGYGARVEFVEPTGAARVARARELVERDGLVQIPAADDARVICGQGTIGLEIVEQLDEIGLTGQLTVLVPVGQGGLAAGVATAVKSLLPDARVLGVEPELAADARDSLAAGEIVRWPAEMVQRTMADGLRLESVAPLPFVHLRRYLDGVLTVSEDEIGQAMAHAARDARLVLEPSGAVSLAALFFRPSEVGAMPVTVLSGGNVDPATYAEILHRYHRA